MVMVQKYCLNTWIDFVSIITMSNIYSSQLVLCVPGNCPSHNHNHEFLNPNPNPDPNPGPNPP